MMEIVTRDAIDYIESFRDKTFDLVILDPNYQDWDDLLKRGLIEKTMRVLKDTGNVLCFTKQPFDYNLRIAVNNFFRREIVWTFENGGAWCSNKMPLISAQKIYWLVKSKQFYFNPRTGMPYSEKTKDFKRATKVFGGYESQGKEFVKSDDGVWLRDHLHYNKPMAGKIPAKPKELAQIFVKCFSPTGGTILDPFLGGGVFVETADEMEREAYGCDNNEKLINDFLDKFFARWE